MEMANYFLLVTCLVGFALAEVPSYIQICGRKNPKLNECVTNSVEALRTQLKEGIPELNVPSVEPMNISEIVLANENNFKAKAQNVRLYGFPTFEIKTLDINLEKQIFRTTVYFKTIKLEADYDVIYKVGPSPIGGKGPINIVVDGVEANVILNSKLVNHKGKTYIYFPSMTTKLTIKDYKSEFKPRDNDGPLAAAINDALNGERQPIIATITPNIEKSISEIVLRLGNLICKNFEYDELFPDRT